MNAIGVRADTLCAVASYSKRHIGGWRANMAGRPIIRRQVGRTPGVIAKFSASLVIRGPRATEANIAVVSSTEKGCKLWTRILLRVRGRMVVG